jgi:Monooxygenase subunit B protein
MILYVTSAGNSRLVTEYRLQSLNRQGWTKMTSRQSRYLQPHPFLPSRRSSTFPLGQARPKYCLAAAEAVSCRRQRKSIFAFSTKKAIFTISLLAIIVAIIGFFSITQPSQSPNAFLLQADIISSTYPLQVKVLGAIYTVSDRKLKFDLKITNAGKKPVRLGEFQSAGVRFLNPDVYTSKLSYPENLVADHGLSLSDDSPIPPGATREITVSIQDTRQSDRLSYDVNKSPPSLLYFFDPLGSRYEVDIGGFVRTRS